MTFEFLQIGRLIYAAAIVGFGLLCLIYLDFINSLQPVPAAIPGFRFLAIAMGLVLAASGAAIMHGTRGRPAALTIAAVFLLGILVLHIPSAFTNPELLLSPWWIRTFESLALGGAALVLAGQENGARGGQLRTTGRILFGISLPVFGALHFAYPDNVASLVPAFYPWPLFWAYLTGAGHIAAGLAIASGLAMRMAAIAAGFMYASWALTLHLYRVLDNPPTYSGNRPELTSLFVCIAFAGAAWVVTAAPKTAGGRRGHG